MKHSLQNVYPFWCKNALRSFKLFEKLQLFSNIFENIRKKTQLGKLNEHHHSIFFLKMYQQGLGVCGLLWGGQRKIPFALCPVVGTSGSNLPFRNKNNMQLTSSKVLMIDRKEPSQTKTIFLRPKHLMNVLQ